MSDPVHPDQPYAPSRDEVHDAFVDFMCDHSNSPLTFWEATAQFDRFLASVRRDAQAEVLAWIESEYSGGTATKLAMDHARSHFAAIRRNETKENQ